MTRWRNQLYYGDCIDVMRDMPPESINLIYLDPPFNSNRNYNAIYKDSTGRPLPEQIEAFSDIWLLDAERMRVIEDLPVLMRKAGVDDAAAEFIKNMMVALHRSQPKLLAYLSYMIERLLMMRDLLKPSGSVYLHCDPTASHYIKIVMDAVFGNQNFLNELIWHYGKWTNAATHFQKNHDVILVYAKSKGKHIFNKAYKEQSSPHYEKGFHTNTIEGGVSQLIVYDKVKAKRQIESGRYDKIVYREGRKKAALPDVWYISLLNSQAKERLGYPTQKPITLLKQIIKASSNKNDVVFDPFCGCATTICAAHELGRKWIGIDIAYHAVRKVVQARLKREYRLAEGSDYLVAGYPKTIEGATDLWRRDKYQFQRWVIEQLDGFVSAKKTADGGIDGRIYFHHPQSEKLMSMILEVKGGENVGIGAVRDLRGALERSGAQMAGLIVRELSAQKRRNFETEMAAAGNIEAGGKKYPKMQLLTLAELMDERVFKIPGGVVAGVSGQGNLALEN